LNVSVVILVLLGHFLLRVFLCACTTGVSENAVLYFDILRFFAKQLALKRDSPHRENLAWQV
jgi:hypothetical protein